MEKNIEIKNEKFAKLMEIWRERLQKVAAERMQAQKNEEAEKAE